MQSKFDKKKIETKLKKYSSDIKFKTIENHALNKSPSKNVPSFNTGSLRFLKHSSFSPNKFYDIPGTKSKKAVSFGYGNKTNFEKKQFIEPTRYKVLSTFDLKILQRKPGPTFGISRQEFYKGKFTKKCEKIGPGKYTINSKIDSRKNFYIGMKINKKCSTQSPGPAAYNILNSQNTTDRKCSVQSRIRGPKMKTEYFEKTPLEKYDNKIPGPGSYDLNLTQDNIRLLKLDKTRSKLPQCPRFRVREEGIPSPGHQQQISKKCSESFSVFGN